MSGWVQRPATTGQKFGAFAKGAQQGHQVASTALQAGAAANADRAHDAAPHDLSENRRGLRDKELLSNSKALGSDLRSRGPVRVCAHTLNV